MTTHLSAFTAYSTPDPATQYSAAYFRELTFKQATLLVFPTIYEPGSVSAWTFTSELTSEAESRLLRGEGVPDITDVIPIIREMEHAFSEGARSVAISFLVEGKQINRRVHLSKIRLFHNVNNNKIAVESARALVSHLRSSPVLSPPVLESFLNLAVRCPIFGFCVADFPMFKLSCLLGEAWLHEDVLNALAELLYFTQAASSPLDFPSTLILPTNFLNDAKYLFDQSPRFFSRNLVALQNRLESTSVDIIFAFNCHSDHFSTYTTSGSPQLVYGDSMHLQPDANILAIFQWFLSGSGFPSPTSVQCADVASQGSGSGSCGIAALNFVETELNADVGHWSTLTTPFFRHRALRDLITYHVTAATYCSDENYDDWVTLLRALQDPGFKLKRGQESIKTSTSLSISCAVNSSDSKPVTTFMSLEPIEENESRSLSEAPFVELPRLPSSRIILDLARTPPPNSSNVIDLCSPTPPPDSKMNLEAASSDVIDLTLSPEERRLACPFPRRALVFGSPEPKPEMVLFESEKNICPSKIETSTRPLETVDAVRVGSYYPNFEAGQAAVYTREARLGHVWRIGQTKRAGDGSVRRVSLRCNHYGDPNVSTHLDRIDSSDYRAGRTIRTNCTAHVNLVAMPGGGWHVTVIDWTHNHPPQIPVGGHIPRRPTEGQRELVAEYATTGNFTRSHLSHIFRARFPDHILEPQQISNLINTARKHANDEVQALGGDFQSVLTKLRELKEVDPRWDWDVLLDENQVVIALWWQSPKQVELCRRFYDILLNDNTYCRNQYGYPLNIGITIDNFGSTRNIWYAVHRAEDIATHAWVFKNHLRSARRPPEVLGSDRHHSLISSAASILPLTFHFYCLHHLGGNVETNLRPALRSDWDNFKRDFWVVYNAVSPDEFERLWGELTTNYPSAARYLDQELYPCRAQWAWAWMSNIFTAGVRTTGRLEGENRINSSIGGPKKSFLQLFNGLNARTEDQTTKDLIQPSRRRHDSNLEALFAGPLQILRNHAGPFALQTCYRQMQDSLFYSTEVVQLPHKVTSWTEYALKLTQNEHGFQLAPGEANQMLNPFTNDNAHISIRWLIALVMKRELSFCLMAATFVIVVCHLTLGFPAVISFAFGLMSKIYPFTSPLFDRDGYKIQILQWNLLQL
ncbi:hypothetical protein MSAN_02026900 [Mycena sanguinolenta]|uniref:MULE transposase domain-containing protein n=1 Tax=Mycena sanguinolenta TaxID=230812 RepID=A0A8H6XJG3_9AGAR|nr:hypothetical protein MSAN_02026900 [Mycena sanguinolenta]